MVVEPRPSPHRLADLAGLLRERGMLIEAPMVRSATLDLAVAGVAYDSRRVKTGDLFVALVGRHTDGHAYAAAAQAAGAVAVICEHPLPALSIPGLVVRGARPALALAAAWLQDFPSRDLGVVGITGTDGKTTTAYLARAVLEASGLPTGLVGTIEVIVGGRSLGNPARATTPEAPELQAHLAAMRAAGDRWALIESTSHGLAQDRVSEVDFDVAVLTNVSHEHLEFHGTPEAYRAAKRRLFEHLAPATRGGLATSGRSAVINLDDPNAAEFMTTARAASARLISYGLADGAEIRAVAVRSTDLRDEGPGLVFEAITPGWRGEVRLRLTGRFNVSNALAALGVAEAVGIDVGAAARALEAVSAIPGRMHRIDLGQPFTVVVDYTHTADSLAKVLDELAPVARAQGGGLIVVFGSAGDRDTLKRPMMGRAAGDRCRLVVLTNEDPRSEDPMTILREIAGGAIAAGRVEGHDVLLVPDRAQAIRLAMAAASPGDAVLLAGKGHEQTIEMDGHIMPWDDAATAAAALAELGYGAGER